MLYKVLTVEALKGPTGRQDTVKCFVKIFNEAGEAVRARTGRITPQGLRQASWAALKTLGFSGHRLTWREGLGCICGCRPGYLVRVGDIPKSLERPVEVFVTIQLCTDNCEGVSISP